MNNLFLDTEDDKIRISFSLSLYGKINEFNGVFDDDAHWQEIIDEVVKTIEASYGYSLDLPDDLGIYYPGKVNDGNK